MMITVSIRLKRRIRRKEVAKISRRVIHNVIIPILQKMLEKRRILGTERYHRDVLDDPDLEDYLEVKLSALLGVIRKPDEGHCLTLEEAINTMIVTDPRGFNGLLWKLLEDYVREVLEKPEEEQEEEVKRLLKKLREKRGPPDRLSKLREEGDRIWTPVTAFS